MEDRKELSTSILSGVDGLASGTTGAEIGALTGDEVGLATFRLAVDLGAGGLMK